MRRPARRRREGKTMHDLNDLQHLIYRLITAPDGVAKGLKAEPTPLPGGLAGLIDGDERLSAVERLDIYANGYFYRLLDVLAEDYPATWTLLGADNFHNLVTGYLIEHPPTQPSLFYAGEFLADFLAGHPLRQRWPFIVDLARLERTIIEVFHAPDTDPLDAATLRVISPADWPTFILRTSTALAIVDCEWRVNEVLRAIEKKREWSTPRHGPVSILVWRQNFRVHHRELGAGERDPLRMSRDGASFAMICEAVARAAPEKDAVRTIGRLLNRWLADGLLAQL
jgi:hypothetical protein